MWPTDFTKIITKKHTQLIYLQIFGRNVANTIVIQTASSPPVSLLVVKHFKLFALGERQEIVFPLCCRWPEIRHCSKHFHTALHWVTHPWHNCPRYSLLTANKRREQPSAREAKPCRWGFQWRLSTKDRLPHFPAHASMIYLPWCRFVPSQRLSRDNTTSESLLVY